jgi:ankyrin repeat protein
MYIKLENLVGWWMVAALSVTSFAASTSDLRLVDAVKSRNNDAVHALLKEHADLNAAQGDGSTALHWAANWDDLDTADLLIRAGANVNSANDLGVTPLYLACANGNAAMVKKLLAAGANPDTAAATGVLPLLKAARSGSVDAVRALLAHRANVNAKENSAGQTALMWAAAERHPEVVRVLVEHGADVAARSHTRSLFVILKNGGEKEVDHACAEDNGGGQNGPCAVIQVGGSTALLFAARTGCIECARILLGGGAEVNDAAPDGNNALLLAAHSGEGALATFLLDRGANPNADGAGYTALHAAVLRDDLDLVKALLAHGANPNARYANGTPKRHYGPDFALPATLVGGTPFLLASKYASVDMMGILVASGADPTLAANDGTTPLMAAAGANHRTGGNDGDPPVDESHALEAVKLALDLCGNVNVNAADQAGNTALHIAASRGSNTIVQLLADCGAKLDIKNKDGQTPLALTLNRPEGGVEGKPRFKSTADLLLKLGATE